MDFNTHKRYAKLDDGVEDTENKGVLVQDSVAPEVKVSSEEDKLAKIIADTVLNAYAIPAYPNRRKKENPSETPDQMKERVLLVGLNRSL